MKYLVEKGANVHIQNNDGVSEWDHADSKLTTAVMHRSVALMMTDSTQDSKLYTLSFKQLCDIPW